MQKPMKDLIEHHSYEFTEIKGVIFATIKVDVRQIGGSFTLMFAIDPNEVVNNEGDRAVGFANAIVIDGRPKDKYPVIEIGGQIKTPFGNYSVDWKVTNHHIQLIPLPKIVLKFSEWQANELRYKLEIIRDSADWLHDVGRHTWDIDELIKKVRSLHYAEYDLWEVELLQEEAENIRDVAADNLQFAIEHNVEERHENKLHLTKLTNLILKLERAIDEHSN